MAMFPFSPSFMFDFELTRILGAASSGGCDVGEFKSAVGKIKKHDAESWHAAWNEQAERAERIGDEAAAAGFREPARNAYLRASNYFRAAACLFRNDEPRVVPVSERSVANFERTARMLDGEVMIVEIPYEDGVSPTGWLCMPRAEARVASKTPVVLYAGGADATKEELYFLYGHTGPQLGYAVLCLEGPGQGMLLRKAKIPLRPDFEVVAGYVLDYFADLAQSRPELELDGPGPSGRGGAGDRGIPRSSCGEATDARIKACVAVDPFFSLWDLLLTRAPQSFMKLWDNGWVMDNVLDAFTEAHCRGNFQAGWEMSLGKSSMGVGKSSAMLRRFKGFSLDSSILDRITCPVFLTGPGEGSEMYSLANDSTFRIKELLSKVPASQKEVWAPTDVADGGLTAKIGAWALPAQKTFLFLNKHFEVKRAAL